ncbi:MAG: YARHG domain-containing protein [Lachnospiraceae bacterium]|nr:YARHG domain-containing protein [Lachnospiraceae bacterium]
MENNGTENTGLENVEMKKHGKKFLVIGILGALIAVIAIAIVVIKVSGSSSDSYNDKLDLGRRYLTELNYEQAVAVLEEAIKINPKNAEAYIVLADVYEKSGNKEKARDVLKRAEDNVEIPEERKRIEIRKTEIDEDTVEPEKYEKLIERAEMLVGDGKTQDAIVCYEEAIDVSPEIHTAYIGLFDIYVAEKEYSSARIVVDGGIKEVTSKSGQMKLEICKEKLEELIASGGESGKLVEKTDDKDSDDKNPDENNTDENTEPEPTPTVSVEKSDVLMNIRQIDNSKYPELTVYADITDVYGNNIDDIYVDDIYGEEIDRKGGVHQIKFSDVFKIIGKETISINLIVDRSGSMTEHNAMQQVKNAINYLIDNMNLSGGDRLEIMSFDDYVYLEQAFTSNKSELKNAVNNIYPVGMTALYDAIYSGLYQSYYEEGSKCVIAFTDGLENASSYTFDDIVALSNNTGIPVYIVGVGEEWNSDDYRRLTSACGGTYYSANYNNLESALSDIYISLYKEQQDYYALKFKTKNKKDTSSEWTLALRMSNDSVYSGECEKKYFAKADMTGAFSNKYFNVDYILDYSNVREVKESDLAGLSLAELRIARNEIFARHGRQFKDPMLNQWFYSKKWYLRLRNKYSPSDFEKLSPYPLSSLENKNADTIKKYEERIMSTRDIFPNASFVELSTYDLALTKDVLKKALKQMETYQETDILKKNRKLINDVIKMDNIKY